jgi:hypothetical protein
MVGIAGKTTGKAFNAARAAVIEKGRQEYALRTGQEQAGARSPASAGQGTRKGKRNIYAYRSSMLDQNVCSRCLGLDFESGGSANRWVYGTKAYWNHMPPAKCLGGGKCRCVFIHAVPEKMRPAFEKAANTAFTL